MQHHAWHDVCFFNLSKIKELENFEIIEPVSGQVYEYRFLILCLLFLTILPYYFLQMAFSVQTLKAKTDPLILEYV